MRLSVNGLNLDFPIATQRLVRQMVSSLCGLDQMVVVVQRGRYEPRFFVAAAQLSGVHVLLGQQHPGSYHIGATGVMSHEALIRTLGESVERYSQFVSDVAKRHSSIFATYEEMLADHRRVIDPRSLELFSEDQLVSPGFRFRPFSSAVRLTWVEATSLRDGDTIWVPSQLVLVGYAPRHQDSEPWLAAAVTTGSAAHTSRIHARRNALLELVQVDAAIGHWYSDAIAPEIRLDHRTGLLTRIIERYFPKRWPIPHFHWLASPELGGMIVACVMERPTPSKPAIAVGCGVDTRLVPAMYKAMLEAIGVMQLAKVNMVSAQVEGKAEGSLDPEQIYDLDSNVAYYAWPDHTAFINEKFARDDAIPASGLPGDSSLEPAEEVDGIIARFNRFGKELVELDLTTDDIRDLGFVAVRMWSPDLLSIPLPSAPPMNHKRFESFGGATHRRPHPYP